MCVITFRTPGAAAAPATLIDVMRPAAAVLPTKTAWAMPGLEPVYKVTILPRGRTGGHALVVPEDAGSA